MTYQGTYTFIPPPPLPEFYQQRDTGSTSSSASVEEDAQAGAAKDTPISIDGAYAVGLRGATKPRAAPTPLMAIPPIRPAVHAGEVPPLAIYHICRVCLRPRSPRYHRDHPIPIDGLPPPPGICRRCRVTSVEDIKRVADVVRIGESNDIKIGFITPFVPDDAVISNAEMRAMNVDKYLRTSSARRVPNQARHQPRKDIVYRHVKGVDEAEDEVPTRRTKVKFTSREDRENTSEDSVPETPLAHITRTTSMHVQPTENPPSIQAKATEGSAAWSKNSSTTSTPKNSTSKASTSTKTTTSSSATVKGSAIVSKLQPGCTGSEIRQIAREEVERYRDAYWIAHRSDSNIRRIAREEVERYREAERKLETHPDPYAHGRMVPVERRIEQERDIPDPQRTWTQKERQPPGTEEGFPRKYTNATKPPRLPETILARPHDFPRYRDQSREHLKESNHERIRQQNSPFREGDPPRGSSRAEAGAVKARRKEHVRRHTLVDTARDSALSVNSRSMESRNFDSSEGPNTLREHSGIQQSRGGRERNQWCHAHLEEDTPIEPPLSQGRRTCSSPSKSMTRDGRQEGANTRNVDSLSSGKYETSGKDGSQRGATKTPSERVEDSSKRNLSESQRTGQSEEDTQPGKKDARRAVQDPPIRKGEDPVHAEFSLNHTRMEWPVETPTEQSSRSMPSRSKRSDRNSNIEFLYAERIVQPAYRPLRRRPFDDHPPARYVQIEELVETRRGSAPPEKPSRQGLSKERPLSAKSFKVPTSTRAPSRGDEEKHYCRYEELRKRAHASTDPDVNVAILAAAKQNDRTPSHRKTVMEVDEHVTRPSRKDSLNSQQQSHSHSNYGNLDTGDSNHVRFSGEVDVSPTPPDSDAGSSEFRAFHDSGRKSPSQMHGSQTSRRSEFSFRESERTDSKPHRKVTTKDSTGRERLDEADRRARKEQHRKLSGAGDRPLGHALSESPSREGSVSSLGIDGRGPYRVQEKVTDSMRVEDGSPGARVGDQREETLYTRRGDGQKSRQRQHD